jgi:dihydroorotate dehydrogenase (NAD+) catalytic subunit
MKTIKFKDFKRNLGKEDNRLRINLGDLQLKNPILTASGTFGYGIEYKDFFDVSCLGGIIVKGTTKEKREGNPYPRLAETEQGIINAVGLQNKGVDYFISDIYPKIKDINDNLIVNVAGSCVEDYVYVAEKLNDLENINAIELNISCPNVKHGGMGFGTDCKMAANVTKEVRRVYKKHLMVKLTPNVTSVVDIAKSVEGEGADSVSLINTVLAMAVDCEKQLPILSTTTGGLSGPAIKPIALRQVWQVAHSVKIPVVGVGGICSMNDVVEFLLVGASAVEIGTMNFIDPTICPKIIKDLSSYFNRHNISNIKEIIGKI